MCCKDNKHEPDHLYLNGLAHIPTMMLSSIMPGDWGPLIDEPAEFRGPTLLKTHDDHHQKTAMGPLQEAKIYPYHNAARQINRRLLAS